MTRLVIFRTVVWTMPAAFLALAVAMLTLAWVGGSGNGGANYGNPRLQVVGVISSEAMQAVTGELTAIDGRVCVEEPKSLASLLAGTITTRQRTMRLLTLAALIVLLLTVFSLAGSLGQFVESQKREIAICKALGASWSHTAMLLFKYVGAPLSRTGRHHRDAGVRRASERSPHPSERLTLHFLVGALLPQRAREALEVAMRAPRWRGVPIPLPNATADAIVPRLAGLPRPEPGAIITT